MEDYEVLVVGNGSAKKIAVKALEEGKSVALVGKKPMGGTCMNFGCIPSKMIIYSADRWMDATENEKFGITSPVEDIDFNMIMNDMRTNRSLMRRKIAAWAHSKEKLDYYEGEARFVDDRTLKLGDGTSVFGEKVFIGTGSRPFIPPIQGIEDIDVLTNENVFDLMKKPCSIAIIGGGAIGVEFAHFFQAMGVDVTIIQRSDLLHGEDPEIANHLKSKLSRRMRVLTETETLHVEKTSDGRKILIRCKDDQGKEVNLKVEKLMVATGRTSNGDKLDLHKTGVETDERNYIKVDENLKTTNPNIWSIGDANGEMLLKHVADYGAYIAWENSNGGKQRSIDYDNIPRAIYTWPKIAAVGMTEKQARKKFDVVVSKKEYLDVAKGVAMREEGSFAKAIFEKGTCRLLGFHICGHHAPLLIQEVVQMRKERKHLSECDVAVHPHPALTELVRDTLLKGVKLAKQ